MLIVPQFYANAHEVKRQQKTFGEHLAAAFIRFGQ